MDYSKTSIPEFKCHKKVKAFKILNISTGGSVSVISDCTNSYSVVVDNDYLKKHNPQIGGYYVLYKDGYESFSPKEAFEDGYALDSDKEGAI